MSWVSSSASGRSWAADDSRQVEKTGADLEPRPGCRLPIDVEAHLVVIHTKVHGRATPRKIVRVADEKDRQSFNALGQLFDPGRLGGTKEYDVALPDVLIPLQPLHDESSVVDPFVTDREIDCRAKRIGADNADGDW